MGISEYRWVGKMTIIPIEMIKMPCILGKSHFRQGCSNLRYMIARRRENVKLYLYIHPIYPPMYLGCWQQPC